jgi:hypothetical protein
MGLESGVLCSGAEVDATIQIRSSTHAREKYSKNTHIVRLTRRISGGMIHSKGGET